MKSGHLSTEARQLIEAGRQGHEATELARARVRRAVTARLAGGAAALSLVHTSSLFAASKLGIALAVAGGVGAGVWYGLDRESGEEVSSVVPAQPATTLPTHAPNAAPTPVLAERSQLDPEPATGSTPTEVQRSTPAGGSTKAAPVIPTRPAPQASQLTEEVAVLARASAQLNQGNAAGAAQALAEYDRTFKTKILIQERTATGVLVECARGNVRGARSAARRFYKTWPRSPLASRIAGSCAGNVAKP